jgi:hypothetical protein
MADLEDLLQAAAWVQALPQEVASPWARARAKAAFANRGGFKHRAWVDDQARAGGSDLLSGMAVRALDRRLDEAVTRLHAGEEAEKAIGLSWLLAEVQDLMKPAGLVHALPRRGPGRAARVASRNTLAAQTQKRRRGWEASHFRPGVVDSFYWLIGQGVNRHLDHAVDALLGTPGRTRPGRMAAAVAVEVQDLMLPATAVHDLPSTTPAPGGKVRGRNLLMADAAQRRVAWVHRHDLPLPSGVRRRPRRSLGIGSSAVLALLAVAAVLGGAALAGLAGMSEPDAPLYGVKRAGENALLTVAGDGVSRADLRIQLAQQRLREAEAMAVLDKPELAVPALQDRFDALRSAGADLASETRRDQRWTKTRDRFLDEESKPASAIEVDLQRAGHNEDADAVKQEIQQFQNDRKSIDRQLGKPQPAPSPVPSLPAQ